MANAVRGETDVVVGGRTLTLSFSVNTICEMETRFPDKSLEDLGRWLTTSPSVAMKRTMLFHALRDHHPEMDERTAGELLVCDENTELLYGLVKAWGACWPIPKAEDAKRPPAGPLRRRRRPRLGLGPPPQPLVRAPARLRRGLLAPDAAHPRPRRRRGPSPPPP
jgi:hypothetical protein